MRTDSVSARCVEMLRRLIDDALKLGVDKLPPEREIATRFAASRGSVRAALSVLEREGVIFRTLGRRGGSYIRSVVEEAPLHAAMFDLRSTKLVRDLNHISGVPEMLARQGRTSSTTVVSAGLEPAQPNVADLLRLEPGGEVVSLLRVRNGDSEPWSLERMYLPAHRFPGLLDHAPLVSVYSTLEEEYGVRPHGFEEHVEVSPSDARVSALLGVPVGSALYALRRVSWDVAGEPIEISVDLFRTDRTLLRFSGEFDQAHD
jgi:GntR family transcriptional regulator